MNILQDTIRSTTYRKKDQLQFSRATSHINIPTEPEPGNLTHCLQAVHVDATWATENHFLNDNGNTLAEAIRGM